MACPQSNTRPPARRSSAAPSLPARLLALALVAIGLTAGSAEAQIEVRLRVQDPFSRVDQFSPPFSRDALRDVSIEPALLDVVSQLDSEDFAVREAASDVLNRTEAWRMQIYALLSRDTLSVEQRCRLIQVVRHQLVNMPRGALGIEMSPLPPMRGGPMEIRIADLIPGLPAERVLQVGDRIIEIDDQPLFMQEDLQSRVQSKRPGDMVAVTVKRAQVDENGRVLRDANNEPVTEIMRLEFALGSAELLNEQRRDLRVVSNSVQTARRIEADAITHAFAPQPVVVSVPGGTQSMSHQNPIDQHPAIVNLLVQQEMLSGRNPDHARMMREVWRQQLADLIDLSNHPGLTDDERARMRRVAERFTEIMNAGL